MTSLQELTVPVLLVATALAGPVAALAMAPPAGPDGPVLVLARDPQAVVARAGGRQIGPLGAQWGIIAQGGPGFAAELAQNGAWAVLDAGWFAALCGA